MSTATITLLFLAFAIVMFVTEKLPLGVTSMIVCVGLVITGVLDWKTAFGGFIDSNVILFVAMFIVGGALFETGMANEIGGVVTKFAKNERGLIVAIMVIVGLMSGVLSNTGTAAILIPVVIGCIGALALIVTGVISEKNALKSIDLKTIFLFGGTLSLATALMAPICLSIAEGMGADPRAVLMACVIGGSCAYATPIGMPANTMVFGVGGYKFNDYAKAGLPLIVIATVISMIILPIAFPFFPG